MKKINLIIIMFFLSAIMLIPSLPVKADSKEIYYPVGISDYVDLNNISNFAVSDSKIFYTKENSSVVCYDKISKNSKVLTDTSEIYNICVEGDYVFIFSKSGTEIFNLQSLENVKFDYQLGVLNNAVSVNYKDGKYYFAYIVASQTPYLEVKIYNSFASQAIASYQYYNNINNAFNNSFIAFTESLIVLKPMTGNEIFLFNYSMSNLTPALEGNNTVMNLTSSSTVKTMEVIQSAENNYIFIGTDTETIICTFNGTSLSYNTTSEVLNIMKTFNNELYGYKIDITNVSKYNYNKTSAEFDSSIVFLAGKGSESGRFKDVSNITYKSGIMYVTDSGNNRIQVISDSDITTITTTGNCSEIITDKNNNYYYVIESGNNSVLYKNNNTYVATYTNKKIISIDMGIDGTIYMLTSNGEILSYGISATDPITLGFLVNSDSKLRINHSLSFANKSELITTSSVAISAKFAISVDNNIYEINRSSGVVNDTLTFNANVKDFKFNDAYIDNPVFVLLDNGNFVRSSFTESQDRDVVLENFNAYTCFDLNNITGEIQLYNNNLSAIEIYNNQSFSPITSMPHYYEHLTTATGANVVWKYGEVKANIFVYDYYYYTGNYNKLTSNTKVIILEANEEFAYIGYNLNNNLTFGYIERESLIESNGKDIQEMAIVETENPIKLRTTNKNVSVFKYPSIFDDTTIYTFAQGDIITTLGKYTTSIDGLNYYVVKIGNGYGYICANNVVLSENISKSIKTNAKIKIYDGQEKVNVYLTAEDGASIICQLPEDYKINVVDYDKNQKYTHITFIDDDQQEREGYILTSYVKMDGISNTVITAIVLLVLDIIIAVVVIIFYRHYKKKQKENSINK